MQLLLPATDQITVFKFRNMKLSNVLLQLEVRKRQTYTPYFLNELHTCTLHSKIPLQMIVSFDS